MLVVHALPTRSGPTSLQVLGEIDETSALLLQQRLIDEAQLCGVQPARLLLDLEKVTFLNRSGLNKLLFALSELAKAAVTVQLYEPTPYVIRLLHEANLDGASGIPPHS